MTSATTRFWSNKEDRVDLVERLRERFLIRRFQCGNSDAFVELVRRYERCLLYYLGRFERDPERALDILQEVWLSAWKARASLRVPDAIRTWLYRIAHGQVVGIIRLEMRSKQAEQNRRWIGGPVSLPGLRLCLGQTRLAGGRHLGTFSAGSAIIPTDR